MSKRQSGRTEQAGAYSDLRTPVVSNPGFRWLRQEPEEKVCRPYLPTYLSILCKCIFSSTAIHEDVTMTHRGWMNFKVHGDARALKQIQQHHTATQLEFTPESTSKAIPKPVNIIARRTFGSYSG